MKKLFLVLLFSNVVAIGQISAVLKQDIANIVKNKRADVGFSISGMDVKDSLSMNGNKKYPMQSVYKFHIAIVILSEVDKGKFSLDQNITIAKQDLVPNTWSPIREAFPNGTIMKLREVLKYTVSGSDNIGCDILLKLLGGAKVVDDFYKKANITGISIQKTEEEMHQDENAQFSNWITPNTSNQILSLFYNGKFHSEKSKSFLWKTLAETPTGMSRIKGNLPKGTIVGHKTGSSGVNAQKISVASNDIGIIMLPNGKYFIASFFIANSPEKAEVIDKIIADISLKAWEYFANEKDN